MIRVSDPPKCILIIAGEASGDMHGARLVSAMKERDPSLFFCGIGGPALHRAGTRIVVDMAELSVVGITEVFSHIPKLLKSASIVRKLLKSLKPDLLILIDFLLKKFFFKNLVVVLLGFARRRLFSPSPLDGEGAGG